MVRERHFNGGMTRTLAIPFFPCVRFNLIPKALRRAAQRLAWHKLRSPLGPRQSDTSVVGSLDAVWEQTDHPDLSEPMEDPDDLLMPPRSMVDPDSWDDEDADDGDDADDDLDEDDLDGLDEDDFDDDDDDDDFDDE